MGCGIGVINLYLNRAAREQPKRRSGAFRGRESMETFTIKTEGVNVAEIMKEIQRRVLEKKQAGVYSDAELERISALKQELSPNRNERYTELSLHLRKLHNNWDVAASSAIIRSHRKIIGPLLVLVKRMGFKLLTFFGSAFFTRQTEYNAAGVQFSAAVLEELTRLSEENKQLQRAQQQLLRRIERLQARSPEPDHEGQDDSLS